MPSVRKRDLVSEYDLTSDEILMLVDRAGTFRQLRQSGGPSPRPLEGLSIGLLCEKPSLRQTASFSVAVHELGGNPVVLTPSPAEGYEFEPVEDLARTLSRYLHVLMVRTFAQERLEALAATSSISVINVLTDALSPCNALAGLATVAQRHGDPRRVRYAWIGDGSHVANSWVNLAGAIGLDIALACPEGFEPDSAMLAQAHSRGAQVRLLRDPQEAASSREVIMTGVWTVLGQESDALTRRRAFSGSYVVDRRIMARAAPGAIFLHALPAHRGEEASGEVLDGPASAVFDQAENALHSQKALLELLVSL